MNKTYIATMGERFFMSKIAIATDSNSGITQAQGRELGIFVMPMPFYINDELFLEDITLSQEQFYQRLEEGADVKTTQPAPGDVLDVLHKVGGLDIAGLAGVFLGGALCRTPVLVDGFISSVAALVAARLCPACKDYMLGSHASDEPASKLVLAELGLEPFLYAGM